MIDSTVCSTDEHVSGATRVEDQLLSGFDRITCPLSTVPRVRNHRNAQMWEASAHGGVDPDRVSFVAALRLTRRSIAHQGDFSPSGP